MKPAMKSAMILALLVTTSACARQERPRIVSDFCLNAKRLTAEPAPAPGVDDPGNQFDTDETFVQVIEHNNVVDRLCPDGGAE